MDFHEYSKGIVKDYLGTVAYVDDVIFKESITRPISNDVEKSLPLSLDMREITGRTSENQVITQPVLKSIATENRNIDPFLLTNSFTEKGIHCSLLELSEDLSNRISISSTLKKSDVVIFDWQMHFDNGANAKSFIRELLSYDQPNELSLRLIAIYTDKPAYNLIINEEILPIFQELNISDYSVLSDTKIESGYTRIIVIPKSEIGNNEPERITCSQLPDIIINEIANLNDGIVSCYALKSILSIKKNAHKLLGVYNKSLDPGYFSHKMLLANPVDSKEQVFELIGSEIKSIIKAESNGIIENDLLEMYFNEKYNDYSTDFNIEERQSYTTELPETLTGDDLLNIVKAGIEPYFFKRSSPQDEINKFNKHCHKSATEYFLHNKDNAQNINCRFSILTTLKSFTSKEKKYLDLGTIVREDVRNGEYFLCIQPKCDSVRISQKSRDFIFIKLIAGRTKDFNIIIPSGDFLKIDYTIYYSNKISLSNIINGRAESIFEDGKHKFVKSNKQKLIWIGELKSDFAQNVSNNFAAQLSRVGVDHYEWLRRS